MGNQAAEEAVRCGLSSSHVPRESITKEKRYWCRQLVGLGSLKFISGREV